MNKQDARFTKLEKLYKKYKVSEKDQNAMLTLFGDIFTEETSNQLISYAKKVFGVK